MKPRTGFRATIVVAAITVAIFGYMPSDGVAQEPAETESGIAARIDTEVITTDELDRVVNATMDRMRSRGAPVPDESQTKTIYKDVLSQMIDGKVLSMLARNGGYEVSDEEVDAVFAQQKGKFPSEQEFLSALEGVGMTVDGFRGRLREQSVTSKFVDDKTKGLKVTEEEIETEYQRLKLAGSLDVPETVDVAHILVRADGEEEAAWNNAEERVKAARKRIVDGEDFNTVMKEISEDPGSGVYRRVPRGRMTPPFEDRMFSTVVDDISEPFKTRFGWHILTVLAKHEGGTVPLADVSERIGQTLMAKKTGDIVSKLIEDGKAGMNIEILVDVADGTS